MNLEQLEYQPHFPSAYRPGIGIIGSGGVVRKAHLPAYHKYGLNVVGIYDISPAATQGVKEQFGVQTIFRTLDDLLAQPEIAVVDIATHPAQRAALIRQALAAGKHVLSQKPLALDIKTAAELVEEARQRGLTLAVNQNGRWAPAWRIATLLIQQGAIGEVLAVTHLFEHSFHWVTGTPFDIIPNYALYDYAIHWFDSIRCWMGETPIASVRAREYRTPNQQPNSKAPWGMWAEIAYENGANAMIRGVDCTPVQKRHPFWIHGTRGTIHGSVLGEDFVMLERNGVSSHFQLEGEWFPDGFAGAMGELLCAIAEEREPSHSAQNNLLTLQMTLAACLSSNESSRPVRLEEVQ